MSQLSVVRAKRRVGYRMVNPLADDLHTDNQDEEQDLPVKARLAQVAANPAIDAEIDEGRERPDFFFFDKFSVEPCSHGYGEIERQRQIFVVKHGGQRQCGRAGERREWSQKDAQNDGGFEGNIRRKEVWDDKPHPHAQPQRDTNEGQQTQGLRRACGSG